MWCDNGEMRVAFLALVEVKAAIESFDCGDCNLFDALDRMKAALMTGEGAGEPERDAA